MAIIKPKEMAERLGVTVKTLQKWDNKGILKAYRTPTNRRYYTEEQYLQYIGQSYDKKKQDQRKNIAYARVSTYGQKDDLANQIAFIREYTNAKGEIYQGGKIILNRKTAVIRTDRSRFFIHFVTFCFSNSPFSLLRICPNHGGIFVISHFHNVFYALVSTSSQLHQGQLSRAVQIRYYYLFVVTLVALV